MCHGCGQLYSLAVGFPVIPVGPELLVRAWGPQDPNWLSTESYFIWAGRAYHTNKVGVLVPAYFPSYFSAQW